MKIQVKRATSHMQHFREGEMYIDGDGDINIVVAATNIENVSNEDLIICCVKEDVAWIRGLADGVSLEKMTRLLPGDTVTLVVE